MIEKQPDIENKIGRGSVREPGGTERPEAFSVLFHECVMKARYSHEHQETYGSKSKKRDS